MVALRSYVGLSTQKPEALARSRRDVLIEYGKLMKYKPQPSKGAWCYDGPMVLRQFGPRPADGADILESYPWCVRFRLDLSDDLQKQSARGQSSFRTASDAAADVIDDMGVLDGAAFKATLRSHCMLIRFALTRPARQRNEFNAMYARAFLFMRAESVTYGPRFTRRLLDFDMQQCADHITGHEKWPGEHRQHAAKPLLLHLVELKYQASHARQPSSNERMLTGLIAL